MASCVFAAPVLWGIPAVPACVGAVCPSNGRELFPVFTVSALLTIFGVDFPPPVAWISARFPKNRFLDAFGIERDALRGVISAMGS